MRGLARAVNGALERRTFVSNGVHVNSKCRLASCSRPPMSLRGCVAFLPFHRATRKCPKPKGASREAKTLGEHVTAKRLEAGLHQADLVA